MMSLYRRSLNTMLHSRYVARADDLGRPLTDDEVRAEARYQLEDLPYKGSYEGAELNKAKAQMRRLINA